MEERGGKRRTVMSYLVDTTVDSDLDHAVTTRPLWFHGFGDCKFSDVRHGSTSPGERGVKHKKTTYGEFCYDET